MVTPSTTTPNLYSLLFLLVPGYVFLRMYLRGHVILDSFSRLDKLLLLAGGGFASLVVFSVLYRSGVDQWVITTLTTDDVGRYTGTWREGITLDMVSNISILQTSFVLLVQSTIGGAIGYYSGKLQRKYGSGIQQSRTELTQPWEVAFEESNKGDKVRIITAQGREIEGLIEQMGSPSENYDLLLSDPTELSRSSGEVDQRDLGGSTYHHFQDISRIEFDKELIPEQDPTPIESFSRNVSKWRALVTSFPKILLAHLRGASEEEPDSREEIVRVDTGTVEFTIIAEESDEDE